MYSWEAKILTYDETEVIDKGRVLAMLEYFERLINGKEEDKLLSVIKRCRKFVKELDEAAYNKISTQEEKSARSFMNFAYNSYYPEF